MEASASQLQSTEEAKKERLPFSTYREYYEDSYKYESRAKVLDSWKTEKENEFVVVLDRTIFHPQGGGQPADEGLIKLSEDDSVAFIVKGLQAKDDAILHIGSFSKDGDSFPKESDVILSVDGEKRRSYARYHSAGHLLDIAVRRVGLTHLSPGKGYHFPVGAYVEYLGVIDMTQKEKFAAEITASANSIIKEKLQAESYESVWSQILPYDEAGKILQGGVPPYIPKGQDLRVVKLTNEDEGCPCGGTHVQKVTDIEGIEVTKIIKKGKNTRISYIVTNSSS